MDDKLRELESGIFSRLGAKSVKAVLEQIDALLADKEMLDWLIKNNRIIWIHSGYPIRSRERIQSDMKDAE